MIEFTKEEYKALAEFYAAIYACHDELEKTEQHINRVLAKKFKQCYVLQSKE